jgi:dephospho-CoA kinase
MSRHATHRRSRKNGPVIVGLTGSIAMGKSTAAAMVRQMGVPVFDSDAVSRAATAPGGTAIPQVAALFPDVVTNGILDRKALGKSVFDSPAQLKRLEAIIHPIVKQARKQFLARAARARRRVVVFDIPLLFETRAERECDIVLAVTAPAFLQRQRVLARPGMTDQLLQSVLLRQTPSVKKAAKADVVLSSGLGRAVTRHQLARALKRARQM